MLLVVVLRDHRLGNVDELLFPRATIQSVEAFNSNKLASSSMTTRTRQALHYSFLRGSFCRHLLPQQLQQQHTRRFTDNDVSCNMAVTRQQEEHDTAAPAAPASSSSSTTATATATTKTDGGSGVDLDEVQRLKREAEKMRLQADQMDLNLTLQKIEALETKLNNRAWLDRHPDAEKVLREQLQILNNKFDQKQQLQKQNGVTATTSTTNVVSDKKADESTPSTSPDYSSSSSSSSSSAPSSSISSPETTVTPTKTKRKMKKAIPPVAGFDQADLDLYIPIANDINKMSDGTNTTSGTPLTLKERMELFRTAPELQQHFQAKLTKLLLGPLAEIQQLEALKQEYLSTNSGTERANIKRKIQQLEESIEDGGPIGYNDGIYLPDDILPPLTDEQLEERVNAIQSLPDILIATYLQRTRVAYTDTIMSSDMDDDDDDDENTSQDKAIVGSVVVEEEPANDIEKIRLAVQLDYYDMQLQLLDQARTLNPLSDRLKDEFIKAYNSLPKAVKQRFVTNIGMLDDDNKPLETIPSAEQVMDQVVNRDSFFSPLLQSIEAANNEDTDPPEYNDIEFVDRSRYLEELFPSIERLEADYPPEEDAVAFANDILGRGDKIFMVTSKPERVIGGYYVRGENLLSDDTKDGAGSGGKTAADKLVEEVSRRLESNVDGKNLKDRLDFFYILDPSTPTDEELEMGIDSAPLFVITAKNPKDLYQLASPLTKSLVTLTGLGSALVFSVGACVLNDRIGDALESSSSAGVIDLIWFFNLCLPLYGSLGAIVLAHEAAHRLVASYYKVMCKFSTRKTTAFWIKKQF
jgi:hypothetical protein